MSGGTADGDQQRKFVTHSSQGVGLVLPIGRSGITIDATTYATMLFTKEYTKYQHCEYGEGQSHVRSQGPASPMLLLPPQRPHHYPQADQSDGVLYSQRP